MNASCNWKRITAAATTKPSFICSFQRWRVDHRGDIKLLDRVLRLGKLELTKIFQDNEGFVGSPLTAL